MSNHNIIQLQCATALAISRACNPCDATLSLSCIGHLKRFIVSQRQGH